MPHNILQLWKLVTLIPNKQVPYLDLLDFERQLTSCLDDYK